MEDKVGFTAMVDGNRADYDLVFAHEETSRMEQADRVLEWLKKMEGESPYRISRLQHCLQTAELAAEDGKDGEYVVCALLHDIGDTLGSTAGETLQQGVHFNFTAVP